jgi:XTP/dITP diphosphohydrolase
VDILLASGNAKKIAELRALLAPLGVRVLVPADVGGIRDVEEDGATFAANARKKARAAALAIGRWALADDSGLEVDALGGAPGVLSARFAGGHGDDAANNRLLLERLAGVPREKRGARFVCAIALADPSGHIDFEAVGSARGRILDAPRGERDFGYDPLFLFTEEGTIATGRGFAELSADEKAAVSHRGRALRRLLEHLTSRTRA